VTIRAAATRRVLRAQGMPPQEIRAVLAAGDPLVVRRLMELHRERLEEWLEEQQRLVASIERSLAGEPGPCAIRRHAGARSAIGRRRLGPQSCLRWGTR
jgi:DNA-binding transcriptional MerR regulator